LAYAGTGGDEGCGARLGGPQRWTARIESTVTRSNQPSKPRCTIAPSTEVALLYLDLLGGTAESLRDHFDFRRGPARRDQVSCRRARRVCAFHPILGSTRTAIRRAICATICRAPRATTSPTAAAATATPIACASTKRASRSAQRDFSSSKRPTSYEMGLNLQRRR
jgi:hypothetical protein